jgi:S1-C subfamily serine protease
MALAMALGAASEAAPAAPAPAKAPDPLRSSVVSVRITGQEWNWRTPWAKQPPWNRVVTGLVVSGSRILVASPSIGNHLLIEVQKLGREERWLAKVRLADTEGPLALLEVDDPSFWTGLAPLALAESVPVSGEVKVYRWLSSGQFDAATASVRQVRAARHGMSRVTLPSLEMTSAMEGGDSEVVVGEGKVLGLVTSRAGDSLTAITSPILKQFLAEAEEPTYPGFSRAGLAWQEMTNPALREYLGLQPGEGGVRLTRVLPHGSGASVLEPGDVLLSIGGVAIDATGQYEDPLYGPLSCALLFTERHRPGDELEVGILRNHERRSVKITLRRMLPEEERIPPYVVGRGPDYEVLGGIVFQELTGPYLTASSEGGRRSAPRLLIAVDREGAAPDPARPRLVVLTSVLPDAANLGFQDLRDLIVSTVNGVAIGSLDDLRRAAQAPIGGYHVVEFLPGQGPGRLVLDVAEAEASKERIRNLYGVGSGAD